MRLRSAVFSEKLLPNLNLPHRNPRSTTQVAKQPLRLVQAKATQSQTNRYQEKRREGDEEGSRSFERRAPLLQRRPNAITKKVNLRKTAKPELVEQKPSPEQQSSSISNETKIKVKFISAAWGDLPLSQRSVIPTIFHRHALFTMTAGVPRKLPQPSFHGTAMLAKKAKKSTSSDQLRLTLMYVTIRASKAWTSKSACVRNRISKKISRGLRLVIEKGAKAEGNEVVFDPDQRGDTFWLIPNAEYSFGNLKLDLFSTPMIEIISIIREALLRVKKEASGRFGKRSFVGVKSFNQGLSPPFDYLAVLEEVAAEWKNLPKLADKLKRGASQGSA